MPAITFAPFLLAAPVAGLTALLILTGGVDVPAAGDRFAGLSAGSVCATSGPLPGLTDAQAQNARTIAATSSARGEDRAALIALMTGLAESRLLVLGNPNDPTGNGLPNQGTGTDHDSLGIFQQRPSWGPAVARMDPVASTNLFLDALLARPDWQSKEPWLAAQDVQVSAFTGRPNASNRFSTVRGGNYLAHAVEAAKLLGLIKVDAAQLDCGGGIGTPPPGPVGANGLPLGYTVPAGTSPAARTAVTFALSQRGKPYLWGAAGPRAYDCSGLMFTAWAHAGLRISRTTGTQLHDGTSTTSAHLRPGDLVLTPGGGGTLASPGHVGMFIGHGLVLLAPRTGDVVKVVTYSSFIAGGVSGLRHIG